MRCRQVVRYPCPVVDRPSGICMSKALHALGEEQCVHTTIASCRLLRSCKQLVISFCYGMLSWYRFLLSSLWCCVGRRLALSCAWHGDAACRCRVHASVLFPQCKASKHRSFSNARRIKKSTKIAAVAELIAVMQSARTGVAGYFDIHKFCDNVSPTDNDCPSSCCHVVRVARFRPYSTVIASW
jgi:hypothetical protein